MTLQKGHHGFPFLSFITPSASDILRWTDRLMTSPETRPPRVAHLDSLVCRLRISVGRGELLQYRSRFESE